MKRATIAGIITCAVLILFVWGCGGGGGGGGGTAAGQYYAYVPDLTDQAIYIYEMNPDTGSLAAAAVTHFHPVPASGVYSVVAHPTKNILYATTNDYKIHVLRVLSSGYLSEIQTPVTTGGRVRLDITSDGKFLYSSNIRTSPGSDEARYIYCFDIADDGTISDNATNPSIDLQQTIAWFKTYPDADVVYVSYPAFGAVRPDKVYSFVVDSTTGAWAEDSNIQLGNNPHRLATYGEYLYAACSNGATLYRTADGGDLMDLQTTIPASYLNCITQANGYIYALAGFTPQISAYEINDTDGTLTEIADPDYPYTLPGTQDIKVMLADPEGNYLYCMDQSNRTISGYGIDKNTGYLTALSWSTPVATGSFPMDMIVFKTK